MNKSSARIGTFLVRVSRPQVSSYSYKRRSGQGLSTQHKYSCLLLGAPEEAGASGTSCYCMGVFKGIEKQVKEMAAKYQEGVALKLSKVTFDGSVTAQYIHTPHQVAVDMGKTTIHIMSTAELLMSALKLGSHVVPPRTVAETSGINSSKTTDVLAIVKDLSKTRVCKSSEEVADAILIDGSGRASDKSAISVAIFGREKIEFVKKQLGKPLVFLNLTIKVADGKREILHGPTDEVFVASECTKAKALREEGGGLAQRAGGTADDGVATTAAKA